ncbi:3-dehydroquinate synthase [Saccharicrinis sp. FJH2]|uniref:3-dehydroquinate synthase n=1 Tax=Saccharicrinis sp. FJH65 TaxID=3344659 RepID=UPI0035F354B4
MIIESVNSKVRICDNVAVDIEPFLEGYKSSEIFILTDDNTLEKCADILKENIILAGAHFITIKSGDDHKKVDALVDVWKYMTHNGADRHSLFISLGGGMVTDLGGFAASTFKRGVHFFNVPTTLLAIVDAAVGGKTGINFEGLKNEIGVINHAEAVLVDTRFLKTLDQENFISGYAEMIKHALLSSQADWDEICAYDTTDPDYELLKPIVGKSIAIKERVVAEDPYEKGIRKALNLGHTIGHALESMAMEQGRPVLHGYAVAWGLISELYLSHKKLNFPEKTLDQLVDLVVRNYGSFQFVSEDYDRLYELMLHDKKNKGGMINFTFMKNIGEVQINMNCTRKEIDDSLDYLRKVTGV